MKFTLHWLKDHLETSASPAEIARALTMLGLEVESVSDRAEALKSFTVAKIVSAEKHPEADKLQVCKVQSDAGELQIVCGAPNARAGLFVVLAKEGALIPRGGMVIKKTKIRRVESNGMLCSADELGLAGGADGIIELPENAIIGQPAAAALGLDDPVFEIAVTPNRADCLGVRGIARDLAAAGLGQLRPLPVPQRAGNAFVSPVTVSIATDKCQQFMGAYVRGVKNAESPAWLKKRLEAIGQKSISALVDITNYITFDLARPLHVFDASRLRGNLTVRDSREGESFAALDGKEYILPGGMAVIADESGPLSVGGIIGGAETGCTPETTGIFLEVALFDATAIAKTGRLLQIESDARYRFERGVDLDFLETGALIALDMIRRLCGGEASGLVTCGKTPPWQRSFHLRTPRIAALGGIDIPPPRIEEVLASLGFTCMAAPEGWTVSPPSWRTDIEGEADLIEEVLRIHGYDHIPAVPLPKLPGVGHRALNAAQIRAQAARKILVGRGFLECCSWSFLPEAQAKLFGGGNPQLKLLNPISADLDVMRPSLLPNLLEAAKKNGFRGFKDVSLCEVGLQFHDVTPEGQRMAAAGIRTGDIAGQDYAPGLFRQAARSADAFDAKADALAVLETLGVSKCDISTDTPPWYHPGRSGALLLGKTTLGYFGELHPGLLAGYDIENRTAAFEVFLAAIPAPRAKSKARPTLKLSEFQAVERDFAFTVEEKITASQIEKALRLADKNLIASVEIFDVYTGRGVEPGEKSVAVKVTLQPWERTLSEADIIAVSQAIITAAQSFDGQLRQ